MEIYKTTNKITGHFYIGLNTTSQRNYLGSGVDLKKQVKKYGKENFIKEILCVVTSSSIAPNILEKIEHAYISNHIEDKMCLNKSIGYTKGAKEIKIKYIEKIIEKPIEVKYIEKIVEVEKIVYVEKNIVKHKLGRGLSALLKPYPIEEYQVINT